MEKLTLDNIDFTTDWEDLGFIESSFMHDKKRYGILETVKRWNAEISSIDFGSDTAYNYAVCIVKYFANQNNITVEHKLRTQNKWVIDPFMFSLLELVETEQEKEEILKEINERPAGLSEFLEAKIIIHELGEAC